MSQHRSAARRPSPATASFPWLTAALADLTSTSVQRHGRLTARVALTIRRTHRDDAGEFVRADGWLLYALHRRWCGPLGRVRSRTLLVAYRPVVDLAIVDGRVVGTGRVGFVRELTYDLAARQSARGVRLPVLEADLPSSRIAVALGQAAEDADRHELVATPGLPRFYWAFDPARPPVFEAHIPETAWRAEEIAIAGLRAWPAEFFVRRHDQRFATHPVDGTANPYAADPLATAGWSLRDGVAYPDVQAPAAIFADLAPWAGRTVRNPAHAVLKAAGIVPPMTHKQWLDQFGPVRDAQRVFAAPEFIPNPEGVDATPASLPVNAAARLHATLTAVGDRLPVLTAAVAGVCAELGIAPEDHGDPADLLAAPYRRLAVAGSPSIRVLDLGGPPAATNLLFEDAVVDLDLFDLGTDGAQASRAAVCDRLRRVAGAPVRT